MTTVVGMTEASKSTGKQAADETVADDATPDVDNTDLKAKFREALKHKEHHDGPNLGGGKGAKTKGPDVPGAVTGKREFRRKTG